MSSISPTISVIMSVFDAENYLTDAIQSILNQTFADFEFIIIDDCSTDNTNLIINSFNDKRIIKIKNEINLGLTKNLNKGLQIAKGKYIARMDADDVALPQRFQKQVDFLDSNKQVVLLGTAFESFGNFSRITIYDSEHHCIRWKQLYECHILHPSVMIRNAFLKLNNLKYDESYTQAQDYDFWARISQIGEIANLSQVLMHYRQCNENVSHRYRDNQMRGIIRVNKFLFDKLGLKGISDDELTLFKDTVYQQYRTGTNYLFDLEVLLKKILAANKLTAYFPNSFINDKIYFLWYHACYNNLKKNRDAKRIFFKSPLKKLNTDIPGKIKFLVKSII